MEERYQPALKAHVLTDERNHVRAIEHTDEYWESPDPTLSGLETAVRYLRDVSDQYDVQPTRFDHLESKVTYLEPREQAAEYRLSDEKKMFDSEIFGFSQTIHNVPVWQAGLKVTIKKGPNRVIMSEDTTQVEAHVDMPNEASIQRYKKMLQAINIATMQRNVVQQHPELTGGPISQPSTGIADEEADESVRRIRDIFGGARIRPLRGKLWIYRYNAEDRLHDVETEPVTEGESDRVRAPFVVPPVNRTIRSGNFYMVGEITFESPPDTDCTVWRALVELETNSVLYLCPLSAFVNCLVYKTDPITKTGTTDPRSSSDNLTLNPHREDVLLQNIDEPADGKNHLRGSYAALRQIEGPFVYPPVEPAGNDFDYDVRTDHFASTSGYFHVDRIFRVMDSLGFTPKDYFSNTTFPVPVDIRCFNGINAHCVGNGTGGIGHVGYGLMDTTDRTNPLGRACDPRVHFHEVLGHGILYESVDSPNMHFTHSAGDALSLIYFDPESRCKGVDGTPVRKPGDLRFTYVPWHPSLDRRADRDIADGWAWGGSKDDGRRKAEEILSTTLFNFYRCIGGDHPYPGNRTFASRMSMYLILRAIGGLTPETNPRVAHDFARHLIAADKGNWTTHGIFGGAYSKVLRWVFEQQGEYQTPLLTMRWDPRFGTVTSPGDPPEVDVYIDDGRAGGYAFQRNFWSTKSIWNRHAPDGQSGHQNAQLGATNYAYVRVKNRGTETARRVYVIGCHAKTGAGFTWPADFQFMSTAFKGVSSLRGNNEEEVVIGPFEWTPTRNGFGFDSLLMVAGADGDMSNVSNFSVGESIPAWRLVPNDNNTAMRATAVLPIWGGTESIVDALDRIDFTVHNPNPEREHMTFEVSMPGFLRERDWKLELVDVGDGFYLPSGGKRDVTVKILPGRPFTAEAAGESEGAGIEIEVLAGGKTIGGMTFELDARSSDVMPKVSARKLPVAGESEVLDAAQRLAQSLGVSGDISKVDVKEIIVALKVKEDRK